MKHQINLDYTIPVGDLAPYFEALQRGDALARKCKGCGRVSFPARSQCADCNGAEMQWHPLKGTARILFRTDGAGGSFALVQFDGADTQSTVALLNAAQTSDFGALVIAPDGGNGIWLDLTSNDARNDDVR